MKKILFGRKRIFRSLLFFALFQIVLLISLPFSQSYLIGNSLNNNDSNIEDIGERSDKENSLLKNIFISLKDFFSLNSIGFVSAAEPSDIPEIGCCAKTVDGGIREEGIKEEDCAEGYYSGNSCDNIPSLVKGYCYDESAGTCTSTIKNECSEPGKFVSIFSSKCNPGCCLQGDTFNWINEKACELKSGNWLSDVNSELECSLLLSEENWGACVYENEGLCDYAPEVSCEGNFHEGEYCRNFYPEESENDLDLTGSAINNGVCLPEINKYKIYKVDKYGNPEGFLEECDSETEKCKNGECINTTCTFNDKTYNTGESWCVFDSLIGEQNTLERGGLESVSADTPGSLHYLAQCVNGEVRINPCSFSGRGSVCVNNNIQSGSGSDVFHQASCELNLQGYCIASTMDYVFSVSERMEAGGFEITEDDSNSEIEEKLNQIENILDDEKENLKKACNSSSQCSFKEVDISEQISFPSCVGSYPTGTAACPLGTRNCTVYFRKNAAGRWVCKENCQCLEEDFIKQMNDHCVSLGDCGSSVNYVGDFSNNIDVKLENSGRLNSKLKNNVWYRNENWCNSHYIVCPEWKQGTSILEILKGRYLGFDDASDTKNKPIKSLAQDYEEIGGDSIAAEIFGQGFSNEQNFWGVIGGMSGAGGIGYVTAWAGYTSTGFAGIMNFIGLASFSQIAGPFAGAFLGAYIGSQIAKWAGQGGAGAILYIIGFSIAGFMLTLQLVGSTLPGIGNLIAAALAVLAIGWSAITGMGKTTTLDVEFNCNEWQAPAGVNEDTCSKCTDVDILETFGFNTCTEYKCNSLGQNCEFINENSELGKRCISTENDGTAPELSIGNVQQSYEFEETILSKTFSLKKKPDNCIPGGKNIWFEIEANEPVQCKYSFDSPENTYEMMDGNYPSNKNDYLETQKFDVQIPPLDSIDVQCTTNQTTGEDICEGAEPGVGMEIYIKCTDKHGNYNTGEGYKINLCVDENIDRTPPKVLKYVPENNKEYPYNPKNIEMKMYLDEAAKCKWDYESLNYESMESEFSSGTGLSGNFNEAKLTGLNVGNNKYYIKCNDTSGNVGSYVYNVNINSDMTKEEYISKHGLEIISFSPDNKSIVSNERPASVLLEVKTSEGANKGKANCVYSFSNIRGNFESTGTELHEHPLQLASGGKYSIDVNCEDLDKISSARENLTFELIIDGKGPEINYTFEQGDLIVQTDELAKCSYKNASCGEFEIEEGEAFDFGYDFVLEQSTSWNPLWEGYSIMCVDELDNSNCVKYENSEEFFGPQIVGIFENQGSLELKTDVEATCYYSFNDCQFSNEEMEKNSMSNYLSKTHKTEWVSGTKYYIKCMDEWENWNQCTIIEPSSLTY